MIRFHDITTPAVKPIVERAVKEAIASEISLEQQVIVHGKYTASFFGDGIRIWLTSFLCDQQSAHQSKLIHLEGITQYPTWTLLAPGETLRFVLVFSGLPKSCTIFDLKEIIPEPGGFEIKNIRRNRTDVYHISFND
ncbi:MAG: hypothetical protein EOO06_16935 [Chitinophagaceae bacterium]|nr:MAG: hypothetical protein EOO06_16935 [Chitinophagaceae bacterium]